MLLITLILSSPNDVINVYKEWNETHLFLIDNLAAGWSHNEKRFTQDKKLNFFRDVFGAKTFYVIIADPPRRRLLLALLAAFEEWKRDIFMTDVSTAIVNYHKVLPSLLS